MGKSKPSSNTTSSSVPWKEVQKYLLGNEQISGAYPAAEGLFEGGGPRYYSGDTVADLNNRQRTALDASFNQGRRGTQGLGDAFSMVQNTQQGDYFNQPGNATFRSMTQMNNPANTQIGRALAGINRTPAGMAMARGADTSVADEVNLDRFSRGGAFNGIDSAGFNTLNRLQGQINPANAAAAAAQRSINSPIAGFNRAQNVDTTVADETGLNRAANQNTAGIRDFTRLANQGATAGEDLTGATARGAFLNANPALQRVIDDSNRATTEAFRRDILPSLDSSAATAGRYGSGAWAAQRSNAIDGLQQNLAENSSRLLNDNFARERGLQEAAQGRLTDAELNRRNQQASAIQNRTGALQNDLSRQLQARTSQADVLQNDRSRALDAATRLADMQATNQGLRLQSANQINDVYNTQAQNQRAAATAINDLYNNSRNRSLSATTADGQLMAGDADRRLAQARTIADIQATNQGLQLQGANAQNTAFNTQQQLRANAAGQLNDAFSAERGRQIQSASLLPQLQGARYADIEQMFNSGTALQEQRQNEINAAIQRFNFNEQRPEIALDNYLARLQGGMGFSSTTQQAPQQSALSRGLGSAASGAALGAAIPGIGPIIGGLGGALLGLFG